MNALKAGVARTNITPPVGTVANGGRPSIGVATELYAKALVLEDGQMKAALVTADVILLGKRVVAETRTRIEEMTGIPGAHVMFGASHTHSGAVTTMRDRWSTIEHDKSYVDQLVAKMAGAVAEANDRSDGHGCVSLPAGSDGQRGRVYLRLSRRRQTVVHHPVSLRPDRENAA